MRIGVVCLCLLFGVVSISFAVPVTFDFSSEMIVQYTVGDLTINVLAESDGADKAELTWISGAGLGVDVLGKSDGKTLDSYAGSDDVLSFAFAENVLLLDVGFFSIGKTDEVKLFVDDVEVFDEYIDKTLEESTEVTYSFLSENYIGQVFSLMAFDSDDSFRIKSITVDTLDPIPTPEPSTWLLLGTGLIGLVFWRKKSAG